MMSNQMLERVSVAYRKGYRDGYADREKFLAVKPDYIKPFADFDYNEGYAAGQNDAKWERRYSEKIQSARGKTEAQSREWFGAKIPCLAHLEFEHGNCPRCDGSSRK